MSNGLLIILMLNILPKYKANPLHFWQSSSDGLIVFYYIVILKCMNDFIFLFVKSLLYIICPLNAKKQIL